MEDRHQADYIPFRCSRKTSRMISQLAMQRSLPKSEVLRDLVDRGLVSIGAKADEDYLYGLVQRAVKEIMQPQVERLAAISAKATHISSAAFFMAVYSATRDCSPAEQRQVEEIAASARALGIQYLKLKDRDIDAFIQNGVKSIMEDDSNE